MLSKSLKNIHLLNKNEYSKIKNILQKIYKKDSCLIKLDGLKNYFYISLIYTNSYDIKCSNSVLDKLVYLYKKYNFFVFNDIQSILFILSACGSLKEFKFFYEIFKKKYTKEKKVLKGIFLVSILYDNLDVFNFLSNKKSIKIKTLAFILATICGSIKIVNYLISQKIDINIKDKIYKKTPLIWAVIEGHIEIVKLLIDRGADINEKDDYYYQKTPIIWAIDRGNIEIVKLLIDKGAKIDKKEGFPKKLPIIWAIQNDQTKIVKLLLDAMKKTSKKEDYEYYKEISLIYAAEYGNLEIVKLLVDIGTDINKKDKEGKTALIMAVIFERKDIVKFLIESGAKIDEKDNDGKTALDYAKKDEIKQLLLEAMEKQKQQQKN